MYRLAHLCGAGGADEAAGQVRLRAGVVPLQAGAAHDAPRLRFEIGHDVFVAAMVDQAGNSADHRRM